MRLLLATTNPDKLREIRLILGGLPVEIRNLAAYPEIPVPAETGPTFADNARLKARYYSAATAEIAVAEDSGLEIDALGGEPGVRSARFGGADLTYPERFAIIDRMMRERGMATSPVWFVCALAVARGDDVLFEARGVVEGTLAPEPRGTGGFGYDPIFYFPPYGRTLAEVSPEEKGAVSHRAQAFRALSTWLARERPPLRRSDE